MTINSKQIYKSRIHSKKKLQLNTKKYVKKCMAAKDKIIIIIYIELLRNISDEKYDILYIASIYLHGIFNLSNIILYTI